MEKDKLRVGIAGYGIVGKRRRAIIDQHPDLKTVAICDERFNEEDKSLNGVLVFPDYKQLLDVSLDVLFVSLPNYMAPEVTIAGLERGMHVFCEKPPGKTVSDIERVIETEKKNPKVKLKYGFNHRYHSSVIKALEIVKSGEMGNIVNVRGLYGKSKVVIFAGGWRADRKYSGGGILLDQGIHMVDLMSQFCGEFTEVKSFISNKYWDHDVEDNVYALMRDEKGRIAILHSSATQWQHQFKLDITLQNGFLELNGILSGSKSYGQEMLKIGRRDESNTGTTREETITYLEDNSWQDEIYEFADSIIKDKPILHATSEEALSVMKQIYRIYWADPEWRRLYRIENPD